MELLSNLCRLQIQGWIITLSMARLKGEALQAWKKKRKMCFISFNMFIFLNGMEYTMNITTLWLYLKHIVPNNGERRIFYGLILAAYIVSAIISGVVIGRIVDKYRNIWLNMQVCIFLVIIGNILYSLPFSVYLLLAGRAIAGLASGYQLSVQGEVGRIFSTSELVRASAICGLSYSIGVLIGPGINLGFERVHMEFHSWEITYLNVPALVLAVCFAIYQLFSIYTVSNLSLLHDPNELVAVETEETEFNLNENDLRHDNTKELDAENEEESTSLIGPQVEDYIPNVKEVVINLTCSINGFLLLSCHTFFYFRFLACDIWIPLLIVEELRFGVRAINAVFVSSGGMGLCLLLCLIIKELSKKVYYFLFLGCIATMAISLASILLLKQYHPNLAFNSSLLTVIGLCQGLSMFVEIYFYTAITLMVPPSARSLTQGIGGWFGYSGALLALLCAAAVYPWLHVIIPVLVACCIALMIGFASRRIYFINQDF